MTIPARIWATALSIQVQMCASTILQPVGPAEAIAAGRSVSRHILKLCVSPRLVDFSEAQLVALSEVGSKDVVEGPFVIARIIQAMDCLRKGCIWLTVMTRLQDRAESKRKKKEVKGITKTPSRALQLTPPPHYVRDDYESDKSQRDLEAGRPLTCGRSCVADGVDVVIFAPHVDDTVGDGGG